MLSPSLLRPVAAGLLLLSSVLHAQQRPLITSADLQALIPHLQFEGRPVANADALALKLAPFRTQLASLSRDGRLLAYTVTEGPYTRIDIRDLDRPAEVHRVQLGDMATAEVLSLRWTSPRQLVFTTEDWVVAAVDFDAQRSRKLISPRILQARLTDTYTITEGRAVDPYNRFEMDRPARVYGVDPSRPDSLLLESVVGSNLRNALYQTLRLDVRTGEWEFLDETRITRPAVRLLSDQAGHVRLQEDRTNFPYEWRVRVLDTNGRPNRWRNLDDVLPAELAASFEAPVADLWSRRSIPLCFSPADPNVLLYATNLDSDTFGVRSVDLRTGEPAAFSVGAADMDLVDPVGEIAPRAIGRSERYMRAEIAAMYYTDFQPAPPRDPLVRDRTDQRIVGVRTASFATGRMWLEDELSAVQAEASAQFPRRRVLLEEWNDTRERFLVRVESPGDPGRFFLYDRPLGRWVEQIRIAPQLAPADLHPTIPFAATAPDGEPITGLLTQPRDPLLKKPPLVIYFADGPWQTAPRAYSGAVQMLAEFGCAVLQLHYRGSAGLGRNKLLGAREAPDLMAAQDTAAALDALASDYGFDRRRVATIGVGYGAWLALRTAEILPDRVRCVVSLNGFNDLSPLLRASPDRELPGQRNENLERAQNAMAMFDEIKASVESLLDSAEEEDPRNSAGSGNDLSAELAQSGATERMPSNDDFGLTSFDFDTESASEGEDSGMNDVFWANKRRLDAAQRMRDAVEATPVDARAAFAAWYFEPAQARGEDLSVLTHIDQLQAEVLICQETLNPHAPTEDAVALRRALDRVRNPPEYWEIPVHAWSRPLDQRPEVWLQVARFFNENLYNFDVQIGTSVEVK